VGRGVVVDVVIERCWVVVVKHCINRWRWGVCWLVGRREPLEVKAFHAEVVVERSNARGDIHVEEPLVGGVNGCAGVQGWW
jgi:hypothetical protein